MARLDALKIEHFRSIENVTIYFPQNKPVILFGQNNAGKSNILTALDVVLGENYPTSRKFEDADFYQRDKIFPISITASFSRNDYFAPNYKKPVTQVKFVSYSKDIDESKMIDQDDERLYLKNEHRDSCCFISIDATTDLSHQLSYYSKYSMLSKLMAAFHNALTKNKDIVEKLKSEFENVRNIFHEVSEFDQFSNDLQKGFGEYVQGFDHHLDIDLSAYDPSNYFRSLKIVSKEGKDVRTFDELGTGEQQVLLFSFAHAYAKTFKQSFILGLEEPESHLHPIAQEWLIRNINKLCESGIQVIITTHSPSFLKMCNLDGFVKVAKEGRNTVVNQHTIDSFTKYCVSLGADNSKTNVKTILPFYSATTFTDQMRGFFARKVILVEGPTEYHSIPAYLSNCEFDMTAEGVDIVYAGGKGNLGKYYRLFSAYNIPVYVIFDNDRNDNNGIDICKTLGIDVNGLKIGRGDYQVNDQYAYFGTDLEDYLRFTIADYSIQETEVNKEFGVSGETGKPIRAKLIAEKYKEKPQFFVDIVSILNSKDIQIKSNKKIEVRDNSDDIPF